MAKATEYQSYGVAEDGRITHAGTSRHRKMTERIAQRIQRSWERWRDQYLIENAGDFPLRRNRAVKTVALICHPVGSPELAQRFPITF